MRECMARNRASRQMDGELRTVHEWVDERWMNGWKGGWMDGWIGA